jgi:hypothetical protein
MAFSIEFPAWLFSLALWKLDMSFAATPSSIDHLDLR